MSTMTSKPSLASTIRLNQTLQLYNDAKRELKLYFAYGRYHMQLLALTTLWRRIGVILRPSP